MSKLEKTVAAVVLVLALLAVLDFVLNPGRSRVGTALRTVRDAAVDQYERLGREPAAPAVPPATTPTAPEVRPRNAASRAKPTPTTATPTAAPGTVLPAAPVVSGPAPTAAAIGVRRDAFFLPGRTSTWMSYDVSVASPVVIRAGGRVEAGVDVAGPDGLNSSDFERRLNDRRQSANQRVLPSAAYLALIGRVCSNSTCTEPFIVGSRTVLCPSDLKLSGTLQLLTNNYVRVDGMQTTLNYSTVNGGYSFYVESAPESSCAAGATRPTGAASSVDAQALERGQTLRNAEFVISSSQSSWKPFFLPLTAPLLVRASGSMQPRGGAESTDPRGVVVPTAASWSYPGTRDLVVDAEHRLYDASFPYQALIGRLCGQTGCGSPFFVGTERVICPTPPFGDRLELWLNHIIGPVGLLGSQTPLTLDAFDLQQRQGAYRFEVSRAPSAACAG